MRTFHIGGTAQVAEQSFFEAANDGVARVSGSTVVTPATAPDRDEPQHGAVRPGRSARTARPTSRLTARACGSRTAGRSSAARVWPSGTPTPPRCITEVAGTVRLRRPGRRPVLSRGGRRGHRHLQPRGHRLARQPARLGPASGHGAWSTPTAPTSAWRTAARPATCCRWARCSRSATATRSSRATCWPACPPKAPRRGTSPAVCRGWPNCSRPAVRRTARSSPRWTAGSSSARTTRTSAGSRSRLSSARTANRPKRSSS